MTRIVEMPLWLLILILAFAAVTFASHFLFPSVRWFLRKRAERVIARLNKQLSRPIEPFKLARRYDTIQRLTYDAEVFQAVAEEAQKSGQREDVVLERARRYAREIVPGFSATLYFGLATRLARWLAQSLYRVRIVHEEGEIPEGATVVYVINHRSNMDYVLVTYLAARSSALSYAMGEWARVWPMDRLLRAMGGYFIRRRSNSGLYRKVLARYVQIATGSGLTQAVFPEGGLSLDGALAKPKVGIIHYIVSGAGAREVVFVPVAINYDRVLEDRVLIDAAKNGERRFRVSFGAALGYLWKLMRRRFHDRDYRFGHAAVVFGQPVALSTLGNGDVDAEATAASLMERISTNMPAPPVPMVSEALLADPPAVTQSDVIAAVRKRMEGLNKAHVILPGADVDLAVREAISGLAVRRILTLTGEGPEAVVAVEEPDVLEYYARTIAHLGDGVASGAT